MLNKKNPLTRFSTEQLIIELERRQKEDNKVAFANWYAFPCEEEDNALEFWIVHKRYWHLTHYVEDRSISNLLPTVPNGFIEIQDSLFEYCPDHKLSVTKQEAVDVLKSYGIVYLEQQVFSNLVTHVVQFEEAVGSYRFSIHPDTKQIEKVVENFCKQDKFKNLDEYKLKLTAFVDKFIVHFWGEYGDLRHKFGAGCNISIMLPEVWASLPPEIE